MLAQKFYVSNSTRKNKYIVYVKKQFVSLDGPVIAECLLYDLFHQ